MPGNRGHYRSKDTPAKARVQAIAEFCAAKGLKVSNREIFKAENVPESTGRAWLREARQPRQKITDPAHPDFREHANRRLTIADVARVEQMLCSGAGPDTRSLPWDRLPEAAGCQFDGRRKPSGPTIRRIMHQNHWTKCVTCRWLFRPGTAAGTCACGPTESQGPAPDPGVGDAPTGGVSNGGDGLAAAHVQAVPLQAAPVQVVDQVPINQVQAEQVPPNPVQAGQVPADPAEVDDVPTDPAEVEHVHAEHLLHVGEVPQWAPS